MEIWHQQQPGTHLMDFMDKKVWKVRDCHSRSTRGIDLSRHQKYHGLGNVIVRLSDGTPESKANAILVNAHLDSTLPSPGQC
jgi:hypothetical protein